MKTLTNYISEKLIINQQVDEKLVINKNYNVDDSYFIYKIKERKQIKVFNDDWGNLNSYRDKIYINGEHIKLHKKWGCTENNFDPGEYYVEIKDIDKINNCFSMFKYCDDLFNVPLFNTSNVESMYTMFYGCDNIEKVPKFDTSKVKNMKYMFYHCKNLKNVPLFDTNKVEDMEDMFRGTNNLSSETEKQWSQIYDFSLHNKKI